jgi:hypothetical protein
VRFKFFHQAALLASVIMLSSCLGLGGGCLADCLGGLIGADGPGGAEPAELTTVEELVHEAVKPLAPE